MCEWGYEVKDVTEAVSTIESLLKLTLHKIYSKYKVEKNIAEKRVILESV